MKRYLVIANQTLGGAPLEDAIEARLRAGSATFHVIVPATPAHDMYRTVVNAYAGALPNNGDATAEASERLERVLGSLRDAGAVADGSIGDPDPFVAIEHALAQGPYDEIILSTLPPGASKWLARDLLHRVERATSVPVTHVSGKPVPPH